MSEWRSFEIPDPISTNALYRNVGTQERAFARGMGRTMRGRAWTNEYKNWRDLAGWELLRQWGSNLPHCRGQFMLDITLSGGIDIDNLKCIPDLLRHMGVIADDSPRHMVDLHVRHVESGPCVVAIRPVGEWA
jgi:hypothetical protein